MSAANPSAPHVLVVGRETLNIKDLVSFLRERGLRVVWAHDGDVGCNVMDGERVDALISELRVQRIDGMRLLGIAIKRNPEVCAVMLADSPDIELATRAIRAGAYDFLCMPVKAEKVAAIVEQGIAHQQLILDLPSPDATEIGAEELPPLSGRSPVMRKVYKAVRQVAGARSTVLITGETGTGKEVVARAIHQHSPRSGGPFVTLNCGGIPEGLVESELFGHEKGAFTGALSVHRGRFEIADGGTLLLDEIGEMSPSAQTRLLRVLQEGEFERVGGTDLRRVDVRVLAATNKDLAEEVKRGLFRADLYYRLRVITIALPSLSERKEDIPLLTETFLKELGRENGKGRLEISRGAVQKLVENDWPGNVRELKNCIEQMVVLSAPGRRLDIPDLPDYVRRSTGVGEDKLILSVGMTIDEVERVVISRTLKATGGDKQRAAEMLGIGLRTLYRKGKRYQMAGFAQGRTGECN